ncbi:hypothetical protein CsatB_009135 [Cannabis sativa]
MPSSFDILARAKKAMTQKTSSKGQSSITGPLGAFASLKGFVTLKANTREDPNKRCRVDLGSNNEEGTTIPRNEENKWVVEKLNTLKKKIEEIDKELVNEKEKSVGLYAQLDDIAFKAMCTARLESFTDFKKGKSDMWMVDEELEVYRKIFMDEVASGDEESTVPEFGTSVPEVEEDGNQVAEFDKGTTEVPIDSEVAH